MNRMKLPKDFQGKSIDVGTKIAFNLSGTVAIGKVVKLIPKKDRDENHLRWHPEDTHTFKIELIAGNGYKVGHISTVTNIRNLISLEN